MRAKKWIIVPSAPSQGGVAPSVTSGRGGGRLNRATSASEESSLGGANVAIIKRGGATWAMQTWLSARHWRVMCYQALGSTCY